MTTNIFDIRYNIYPWMKEKCNVCGHDYYDVKQHLRRAHKVNNFQLRIKRIKIGRISSIGAGTDDRSDIQQKPNSEYYIWQDIGPLSDTGRIAEFSAIDIR